MCLCWSIEGPRVLSALHVAAVAAGCVAAGAVAAAVGAAAAGTCSSHPPWPSYSWFYGTVEGSCPFEKC